jgi:hypothetical protein
MKKLLFIISSLILFIGLLPEVTKEWPVLKGPYLGQKPPGKTPEIFAPGIISLKDFHDFKGSFSPDGKEYYFCRHKLPEIAPALFYTKIKKGVWTEPAPLKITKGNRTFHPCVTHDNQWLLFYWQFKGEKSKPSGYYASARTDTGWSAPRFAGQVRYLTTDNSGTFYGNELILGSSPKFYLTKVIFNNGIFTHFERLDIKAHYGKQTHPCIAPDGSYLIFDIQDKNTNLFVSLKNNTGKWGRVIDLTRHGLPPGARSAYISPDGKYLFYGLNGDIWWVDIKVIKNLRPKK